MSDPTDLFRPMVKEYPAELLQKVDAALTRTQGNREHAAIILHMDTQEGKNRLKDMIRNTPWLRVKWSRSNAEPLNPADPVDIDRPVPPIGPTQKAISEAIEKQDKIVKQDLTKLFNEDEANLIRAIQTQYTGHLQATLDLTYGGAVHSTAKMLVLQAQLQQRLEEIDANPDAFVRQAFTKEGVPFVVKDAHDYRMEVVDRLTRISDLIRKQNTSINEATKTRLMADKLRKEMQQAEKGPQSVAGWTTPATEVKPA